MTFYITFHKKFQLNAIIDLHLIRFDLGWVIVSFTTQNVENVCSELVLQNAQLRQRLAIYEMALSNSDVSEEDFYKNFEDFDKDKLN